MSRYSLEYLNRNTLIGNTDVKGEAWHNRFDIKMADGLDNNYPGFIPADDVIRRLLSFDVVKMPVHLDIPGQGMTAIPDRFAWVRDDNHAVMGIHGDGYVGHGYKKWLIDNVLSITGDDAGIANVILLADGAQCAVQIELPNTIDAGNGVTVSPYLLATTSFDGSIATTYKRGFTNVVCDNTFNMFMGESGETYKRRHTKNSEFDILTAASALDTLHLIAEKVASDIEKLCAVDVSDQAWARFVEAHVPIDEKISKSPKSVTMAENKRQALTGLYRTDIRVAPWAGTAWGVVQAVNTYNEHMAIVRRVDGFERKYKRALTGQTGKDDAGTLVTLGGVIGRDLVAA